MQEDEKYLDIEGAHKELLDMGFRTLSLHSVRRWATHKKLPFFKPPGTNRLYIKRRLLREHFERLQQQAALT